MITGLLFAATGPAGSAAADAGGSPAAAVAGADATPGVVLAAAATGASRLGMGRSFFPAKTAPANTMADTAMPAPRRPMERNRWRRASRVARPKRSALPGRYARARFH